MILVAMSISASGRTTTAFFAPPWHWARFPLAVARLYTCLATAVDPTKLTARIVGWSRIASIASRAPFTRFTTPGGKPACSSSWKTSCIVSGTFSDGLTITGLPQASAYGMNQNGIIPGKLNGQMTALTPTGCRIIVSSMPGAMSSEL